MKNNETLNKVFALKRLGVVTAFSFGLVLMPGCKKDKEEEKVITTDDAADVVEYSLSSSSGGMAEQVSDGSTYAYDQGLKSTSGLECGVAFDTTVTRSHTGTITASFTHNRHYLLSCDAVSNPVSLQYSGSYSGSYDGPRMHSSSSGNRTWTITGLDSVSAQYVYSGSFTHNGEHVSEVRNQYTFNSSLSTSTSNLKVDKTTKRIVGGTSSVNLTCTVSNGNSYSFSGSITFNSDNTATLTLNGNTYTIYLY